jgi:hypothetical protein
MKIWINWLTFFLIITGVNWKCPSDTKQVYSTLNIQKVYQTLCVSGGEFIDFDNKQNIITLYRIDSIALMDSSTMVDSLNFNEKIYYTKSIYQINNLADVSRIDSSFVSIDPVIIPTQPSKLDWACDRTEDLDFDPRISKIRDRTHLLYAQNLTNKDVQDSRIAMVELRSSGEPITDPYGMKVLRSHTDTLYMIIHERVDSEYKSIAVQKVSNDDYLGFFICGTGLFELDNQDMMLVIQTRDRSMVHNRFESKCYNFYILSNKHVK